MIKTIKNEIKNKNEKLRNYLFQMKELNEVVLGKGLFVSIEGQLSLTKGHMSDQEGEVEIEYLPHWKLFLTFFIQIKKKIFFKKGNFKEASDPWKLIFLK